MVGRRPNEQPVAVALGTYQQYVSPGDFEISRSLLTQGVYEPHVTDALRPLLQPGMTFLDLGANIGYFSLLAASLVGQGGRVLAFEPNAYNVSLLSLSARANGFEQLEIFPFAVAERATTFIFDNVGGSNGMISEIPAGAAADDLFNRTLVRSVRLDELLGDLDQLDVVKIDIEGAEYRALQGARQLLERHHPIILSEFSPPGLQNVSGVPGEAYLQLLLGLGYELAVLNEDGTLTDCGSEADAVMRVFAGKPVDHIDIVAFLPAQRARLGSRK